MNKIKSVLTIAGSDCSGGAGIQADIKTITMHNLYATSAITALTAQNTTGVHDIMNISPDFVGKELDCIFEDIFPDAVKIGMVSDKDIIKIICQKLKEYHPHNIVIDPVMVSTAGSNLLEDSSISTLISDLLPMGDVITPNLDEARVLSGISINNKSDMVTAIKAIYKKIKVPVLIKGGHLSEDAADLLFDGTNEKWFTTKRINNPNTHGTGCTLSSAIASNLALGNTLESSIRNAKEYITKAIDYKLDMGKGRGPLYHMIDLDK